MEMQEILDKIYSYLAAYGLKILAAAVIFVIGRWLARLLGGLTEKALVTSKIDKTIAKFAKNLVHIGLLVIVVIAALAQLGVETTQLAVALGAAGLAIGLALQGSLANFASGFVMIVFRPFKVGDVIEAGGVLGTVQEIQLFNTIVDTPDNRRCIIPNGQITGGCITNYTVNGTRRVDLVVSVSYDEDLKKAKDVIEQVLANDKRVLKEPAPTVAVSELADSSVNFVVRPWVKPEDYWDVYFDITSKIKLAFDKNGITIPFPQRDVHMKQEAS
jgi:small conductance mechanosensitive channel